MVHTDSYECYLMSPTGEVYKWADLREAKAFERLQKQAGWMQNRRSILELRAPSGEVVGRAVKGIFEDYRKEVSK